MNELTLLPETQTLSVLWDCDFNDVDPHGCVPAEPSGGLFPQVHAGDTILLTDGMHLCDALVTSLRDGYVTARPLRHTWQEPAAPYLVGRSIPQRNFQELTEPDTSASASQSYPSLPVNRQ